MVFLSIDTKNYLVKGKNGKTNIQLLNEIIKGDPNNKVFILFYMNGCGPCNATRPEWKKLENILKKYEDDLTIAVIDIDHTLSDKVHGLKNVPNSFPTMRYMTNNNKTVENFEDSEIQDKNRTIDNFAEWIKVKTKNHNISHSRQKGKKGGKWSRKYKNSINCRKPKGFSQKQYCKYTRKYRK
jgi:thiol-disulfide isomerase/thioredoxin